MRASVVGCHLICVVVLLHIPEELSSVALHPCAQRKEHRSCLLVIAIAFALEYVLKGFG